MGLTMVPSTVVSEQPGRGWGMEPVVSARSQPHRALWLVTSGQKIPQQRRKMFLAGSFPAGFHLEVTFLCGSIVPLGLQTLHPVPSQGAGKG